MDPLSITVSCASLVGAIAKGTEVISKFVMDCRAARHDLDGVSREMMSLNTVLKLLERDLSDSKQVPENLGEQMKNILTNSDRVMTDLQQFLQKHSGSSVQKQASWAISGKEDANKLRRELEAHRGALNLALDLLNLTISRKILKNTQGIQEDTTVIRQDTSQILEGQIRIREDVQRIRHLLSKEQPRELESGRIHVFNRYFEELTTYADSVCGDLNELLPVDRSRYWTKTTQNDILLTNSSPRAEYAPTLDIPDSKSGLNTNFPIASKDSGANFSAKDWNTDQRDARNSTGPTGITLATNLRSRNGTIDAQLENSIGENTRILTCAISPDGTSIACAYTGNIIEVREFDSPFRVSSRFETDARMTQAVAFSTDGRILISGHSGGEIKLWDAQTGILIDSICESPDDVYSVQFSPDGNLFAAVFEDKRVMIFDIAQLQLLWTLDEMVETETHSVFGAIVRFSPNSEIVAASLDKGDIYIWDLRFAPPRYMRSLSHFYLEDFIFLNSQEILSCSGNHTYRWSLNDGKKLDDLALSESLSESVHFTSMSILSLNEKALALACTNGTVWIWSFASSKILAMIECSTTKKRIDQVLASPNGDRLFAASSKDNSTIWSLKSMV